VRRCANGASAPRQDSLICVITCSYVTRLIHMWHDSKIRNITKLTIPNEYRVPSLTHKIRHLVFDESCSLTLDITHTPLLRMWHPSSHISRDSHLHRVGRTCRVGCIKQQYGQLTSYVADSCICDTTSSYMYMYMYIYIHMYMYMYIHIFWWIIFTYIHVHIYMFIDNHPHIYTHSYPYIYIYIYTHTYVYIYTYIYTYIYI